MLHTSYSKPRVLPINGTQDPTEIDRLQDLSVSSTFNRQKIEELGRKGLVAWKKQIPTMNMSARQYEYGSLEFYAQLANKPTSSTKVEFDEFNTSAVDVACYETNDTGAFLNTVWYNDYRLATFSVGIGDPESIVERNFSLVGENEKILKNDNKYLIYKEISGTTGADQTYTVDDPAPQLDPDASAQYLFRVLRVRAGVTTELTFGTDWSYDGADTLTINGQSYASDTLKAYYSATSYIATEEPFTANDADLSCINAESCSVYLVDSSNYVYRLQSVSADISFDRLDVKEIGNENVVKRGVRDVTTTLSLGRIVHEWTPEEVLRGVAGLDFGLINVRKYEDNFSLIIKMYSDPTKSTFKIGYKFTGLAPTGDDTGRPVNDYIQRGITLTGEEGFITTTESDL